MIYFDNNATTRPAAEVIQAVNDALARAWANPSSVHRAGQEARRLVELAREEVARLIGARPRDLTFTSGGTEAADLAIRGALAARPGPWVSTEIEHAAVRDLLAHLGERGAASRMLPIGPAGVVEESGFEKSIVPGTSLVSVQWANNETGAIQPIGAIARRCREVGATFHCDATQYVGKLPVDLGGPGPWPDLLTFAPHKFHGVKGVGVLWSGPAARLAPVLHGVQERGRRGGTENVPGIAGAGVAARLAREWLAEPERRVAAARLRDRFEAAVLASCQGAVVNGPVEPAARLWNTTNIAFPGLEAEALLLAMSECDGGLAASAGAACSSGSLEPSPVLLAMGVPERLAHGSVRFSLSRETTTEEVEQAAAIVAECVARVSRSGR